MPTKTNSDQMVITLTGLRFKGFHGVLADERRDGQDFVIDVALTIDTPIDDQLASTVDYSQLAQEIEQLVTNDPVNLIESLAKRIANHILNYDVVNAVQVNVHKPQAPIMVAFDDVTVSINATK